MPLFFLLSGFTFSPKPIKQYIHKSTKRLLVPYIFFFVVISLPQLWTMYIEKNVLGGARLMLSMVYGGSILTGIYSVFWFITVLWLATNIFNIAVNHKIKLWILPLLIVCGYLCEYVQFPMPWNINVVPMALTYIWIGFLLNKIISYEFLNKKKNMVYTLIISIAMLFSIFLLRHQLTIDMKYCRFGIPVISLISSILASIAIAIIAMTISSNVAVSKILGDVGRASMVIMYVHQPIKFMILEPNGLSGNNTMTIIVCLVISLSIYILLRQHVILRKCFLGQYDCATRN